MVAFRLFPYTFHARPKPLCFQSLLVHILRVRVQHFSPFIELAQACIAPIMLAMATRRKRKRKECYFLLYKLRFK